MGVGRCFGIRISGVLGHGHILPVVYELIFYGVLMRAAIFLIAFLLNAAIKQTCEPIFNKYTKK